MEVIPIFQHIIDHNIPIRTINDEYFGDLHIYNKRCHVNTSVSTANYQARNKNLPAILTSVAWREIRFDIFNDRCALTGYSSSIIDINLGHFIALNTGHGGSYKGNVFPIEASLNTSMSHYNPFNRYDLRNKLFGELIEYLAYLNGLSIKDYTSFVNWCYANPMNNSLGIRIWAKINRLSEHDLYNLRDKETLKSYKSWASNPIDSRQLWMVDLDGE